MWLGQGLFLPTVSFTVPSQDTSFFKCNSECHLSFLLSILQSIQRGLLLSLNYTVAKIPPTSISWVVTASQAPWGYKTKTCIGSSQQHRYFHKGLFLHIRVKPLPFQSSLWLIKIIWFPKYLFICKNPPIHPRFTQSVHLLTVHQKALNRVLNSPYKTRQLSNHHHVPFYTAWRACPCSNNVIE